jgi:hypothetical protein
MASEGFLFNPLISDNNGIIGFYEKKGTPVDAVTFNKPAIAFGMQSEKINIKIYRLEEITR